MWGRVFHPSHRHAARSCQRHAAATCRPHACQQTLSWVAGEPEGLFSVPKQCWLVMGVLQGQSGRLVAAVPCCRIRCSFSVPMDVMQSCLTAMQSQADVTLCCSPLLPNKCVPCPPGPAALGLLPVHLPSISQLSQPLMSPPAERATAQHIVVVVARQLSGAVPSPQFPCSLVLCCSPLPPALAPLLTQALAHVLAKLQRIFHPAAACLRAALECGSGLGPGLEGLAAQIGSGSGSGVDWGLGAPSEADYLDEDSGEQAARILQPPGPCASQDSLGFEPSSCTVMPSLMVATYWRKCWPVIFGVSDKPEAVTRGLFLFLCHHVR